MFFVIFYPVLLQEKYLFNFIYTTTREMLYTIQISIHFEEKVRNYLPVGLEVFWVQCLWRYFIGDDFSLGESRCFPGCCINNNIRQDKCNTHKNLFLQILSLDISWNGFYKLVITRPSRYCTSSPSIVSSHFLKMPLLVNFSTFPTSPSSCELLDTRYSTVLNLMGERNKQQKCPTERQCVVAFLLRTMQLKHAV